MDTKGACMPESIGTTGGVIVQGEGEPDCTREEYDAIDATNWTRLKEIRKSPLHYIHRAQREDTDALKLGRAVHTAVFEPARFERDFAVWDGERRAGKEWERFKELNHRKTIIRSADRGRVLAIRDAVRASPLVAPYLVIGEAEKTIVWRDRKTGLLMKGRLDWLAPTALLDLKTSRHAVDQRAFARDAFQLGYFHQLALYQRGVATVRGLGESPPAIIVAVETEVPFDVAVYRLSEDALHFVNEDLDELLATLVKCRAESKWPGTFNAEQELELPRWAIPDAEDMDVGEEPAWMKGA
jgi:hypothetical protein